MCLFDVPLRGKERQSVDGVPIVGHCDVDRLFKDFQAQYGAPAYVRRARDVEAALEQLLEHCRKQRDEWLPMVRLHLGRLRALAGEWDALRPWLPDEDQVALLRDLEAALQPRLRVPVERTASARVLRRALRELRGSIERFNRRWLAFLPIVDLTRVNELREGYNRFFLLEKECAVRSPRLARQGFRQLEPLTTEGLAALLPPLAVPRAGD
jgi:hypothetical protein